MDSTRLRMQIPTQIGQGRGGRRANATEETKEEAKGSEERTKGLFFLLLEDDDTCTET